MPVSNTHAIGTAPLVEEGENEDRPWTYAAGYLNAFQLILSGKHL